MKTKPNQTKNKKRRKRKHNYKFKAKKESRDSIRATSIKEIVFVIKTFPQKNNSMNLWLY